MVLYPVVSDYWNSFRQSRAIANYVDAMNQMDNERSEALLQEAREYNKNLVNNKNRFRFTDIEVEEYCSMLGSEGKPVGYVEIGVIDVMLPIYLGTTESILQIGVGAMEGGSLPVGGPSTHSVLTGHRGLPTSKLFTDLDDVVIGDIFFVHVLNETLTYEIDQILIVEPDEMEALAIENGKDYCTMVTCTPYGINSHRMLVRGHRIDTPVDAIFLQVSSNAMQIEPLLVSLLVAAPILLALLLWLIFGGDGKTSKKKANAMKKGGNLDEGGQKKNR